MSNILNLVMELDANFKRNIELLQGQYYPGIKSRKLKKRKRLIDQKILGSKECRKIVTEDRWRHFFDPSLPIDYISNDFFDTPIERAVDVSRTLAGKILIISNSPPQNSNSQSLVNFYNICLSLDNTLIVVWDWDNHHHLHISSILAASADVYLPSHNSHNFELSLFCDFLAQTPLSSIQWNSGFIIENAHRILNAKRMNGFKGRFVDYGLFSLRNSIVKRLNSHMPDVELVSDLNNYYSLTPDQRLADWVSHKGQWIVPTLNDLSTRVFDSLISGNVIAIPRRFRAEAALNELHIDDCIYYDEDDIESPQRILDLMLEKFDTWGGIGIFRRIQFGLNNNLDRRFGQILDKIESLYIKPDR